MLVIPFHPSAFSAMILVRFNMMLVNNHCIAS